MKKKITILLPMLILLLSSQSRAFFPTNKVSIGTQTDIAGTKNPLLSLPGAIISSGIMAVAPRAGFFGSTIGGWVSSAIPLIILNVALALVSNVLKPNQEDAPPEVKINSKLRILAQLKEYENSPNPEERELYKNLREAYTQDMLGCLK